MGKQLILDYQCDECLRLGITQLCGRCQRSLCPRCYDEPPVLSWEALACASCRIIATAA